MIEVGSYFSCETPEDGAVVPEKGLFQMSLSSPDVYIRPKRGHFQRPRYRTLVSAI